MNDINIAKVDPYILDILGGKFKNVEFSLLKADGTRTQCHGSYLISDNGFLNASYFIDPYKARYSQSEIFWSEWLESVRKDVECVFVILKTRFRILLNRINLYFASTIKDVFVTCCICLNSFYWANKLRSSNMSLSHTEWIQRYLYFKSKGNGFENCCQLVTILKYCLLNFC
jgi:hypothetical protein